MISSSLLHPPTWSLTATLRPLPPPQVPIWMNAISAAFGLGSFATPLLTALCEQLFGEPVRVFYIISAMAAASAVPLLFVPSPTKPEDDSDSRGDAPSQAEHRGMRWVVGAAGQGRAASDVGHGLTHLHSWQLAIACQVSSSRC